MINRKLEKNYDVVTHAYERLTKYHNVSVLLYHLVCPAKYRKAIFSKKVEEHLRDVCLEISLRYEIDFIEIGVDGDHVHFLIQSIPTFSPSKIAQIVKSITAREVFKRAPEVKKFMNNSYHFSS